MLTTRLRDEARRSLGPSQTNLTVGHVEWQTHESVEALEARVEAALAPPGSTQTVRPFPRPSTRPTVVATPAVEAHLVETTDALRRDVLESIAREILEARPFGRPMAVVALEVGGLVDLDEVDRESADTLLGTVVTRLSESVGSGTVLRLGRSEFVLVLTGATADDAEALLGSLHVASEAGEDPGLTLSAGITELVERDGAQTALARAEHALWQAKQAGRGTVVVAVPGRQKPRFE